MWQLVAACLLALCELPFATFGVHENATCQQDPSLLMQLRTGGAFTTAGPTTTSTTLPLPFCEPTITREDVTNAGLTHGSLLTNEFGVFGIESVVVSSNGPGTTNEARIFDGGLDADTVCTCDNDLLNPSLEFLIVIQESNPCPKQDNCGNDCGTNCCEGDGCTKDTESTPPNVDDNAGGGTITITFNDSSCVEDFLFVDTEENGKVEAFAENGTLLAQEDFLETGNNEFNFVSLDVCGVKTIVATLGGSGAIALQCFNTSIDPGTTTAAPTTAAPTTAAPTTAAPTTAAPTTAAPTTAAPTTAAPTTAPPTTAAPTTAAPTTAAPTTAAPTTAAPTTAAPTTAAPTTAATHHCSAHHGAPTTAAPTTAAPTTAAPTTAAPTTAAPTTTTETPAPPPPPPTSTTSLPEVSTTTPSRPKPYYSQYRRHRRILHNRRIRRDSRIRRHRGYDYAGPTEEPTTTTEAPTTTAATTNPPSPPYYAYNRRDA
ncbi:unnamed protein product [Effrenium voratum]|nr:unnamed protein product [Effrenium voratum]